MYLHSIGHVRIYFNLVSSPALKYLQELQSSLADNYAHVPIVDN